MQPATKKKGDHAMTNCFEMKCPKCGSEDHIEIFATVCVRLTHDGTDADAAADGNHYWDDDSSARCDACNCLGTVKAFQPNEEPGEPTTA
jgi:RecJ-like exonuclease